MHFVLSIICGIEKKIVLLFFVANFNPYYNKQLCIVWLKFEKFKF